jgi:hypothetical protein
MGARRAQFLTTHVQQLLIIVSHCLDITAPNLIAIVDVALDVEIECLPPSKIKGDVIVLLADVEHLHECHGVQCKFELGTHPNEGRSYELLNSTNFV